MTAGKRSPDSKRTLYVGCALTKAPEAFRYGVERLKEELGADWHVLKFLGLVDGTAADVYTQDIGNVDACDAFLAITDHPSIGLGMEIQRAAELGKPTLLTAQADTEVTRMVFGAAELLPPFDFAAYDDMVADLPNIVRENFAHILAPAEGCQQ